MPEFTQSISAHAPPGPDEPAQGRRQSVSTNQAGALLGLLVLATSVGCESEAAPLEDSMPPGVPGKSDSFGPDDRTSVAESSDPRAVDWAGSVAILSVRPLDVPVPSLQERFGFCEDQPFLDEPFMGHCTGFLIGPSLLATAAHCLEQHPCERTQVVFGVNDVERNAPPSVEGSSVFRCVDAHLNEAADVALVELDREVFRPAMTLEVAREGQAVALVGHGLGSSSTVDLSGVIHSFDGQWIRSSLDTFSGHSGSPIIALDSGSVVGVHVAGPNASVVQRDGAPCNVLRECDPAAVDTDACLASASNPAALPFADAGQLCPTSICG